MIRIPSLVRAAAMALTLAGGAAAQPLATSPLTPPPNSPRHADPTWHAFVNATVHVSPGQTLEHATLVIRDGRIVSVQAPPVADGGEGKPESPRPPPGARLWDCTGLHIYPGFIDAYLEVDAPPPDPRTTPGVHWNARVTPQRSALDGAGVDDRTAETLRRLGFTAAGIAPRGGVFRGSGAVVSLARPASDASADRPPVYRRRAFHAVAFETVRGGGRGGGQPEVPDNAWWTSYPNSQMGAIALVRQTLLDARWQIEARAAGAVIAPNALDALVEPSDGPGVPLLFDCEDELEVLRAARIAREFSRPAIILGSGTEFRRLHAIRDENLPIIVPLRFPRVPDVSTLARAESVELRDLMTWEQAPTNPRRLDAAGLTLALTTHRLRNRAEFAENLLSALRHGLAPPRALAMLTIHPARLLGVEDRLGTLEPGKQANFVIADGDLFDPWPARREGQASTPGEAPDAGETSPGSGPAAEPPAEQPPRSRAGQPADSAPRRERPGARIREVWIDGMRHEISPPPARNVYGTWAVVEMDGKPLDPQAEDALTFVITPEHAVTWRRAGQEERARNVRISANRVDYVLEGRRLFGLEGVLIEWAVVEGEMMHGVTTLPGAQIRRWSARRLSPDVQPLRRRGAPVEADGAPPSPPAQEAPSGVSPPGAAAVRSSPASDASSQFPRRSSRQPPRFPDDEEKEAIAQVPETFGYPFGPYMLEEYPAQENLVLIGGTIWTAGPRGVIADGVLHFRDGKIVFVGTRAEWQAHQASHPLPHPPVELDCTGKHIAPGIIDCHSHTGISGGVNESGQAVTAEVRIEDVTNPDAISWYRQLAAGVTTVNSLHGSANAIGGQNCVNKIRWGVRHPDYMHFEGAPPGIKFALGENPKQSNWGDRMTTRYPQTRMGVEAIIRDRFLAAAEYRRLRDRQAAAPRSSAGASGSAGLAATASAPGGEVPLRRDLELEALADVLDGTRLVHCHSYRQDEILMLCRLASEFGFTIGTFQHVLEGYKVADEIAQHARGASCFSDWWAYKVEVQDAIPQGGPIMHERGVCVSFNSDSDELARRLNTEAAKAVKYGGLDPHEALKFVTLNPARQLGIEHRVGSLEVGKDADLAIWSASPLSALARCEMTFVDGRRLFSLQDDARHRERIVKERTRLIQKALAAARRRGPAGDNARPQGPRGLSGPWYRPTAREQFYLDLINRGFDPEAARPGVCGCDEIHDHDRN